MADIVLPYDPDRSRLSDIGHRTRVLPNPLCARRMRALIKRRRRLCLQGGGGHRLAPALTGRNGHGAGRRRVARGASPRPPGAALASTRAAVWLLTIRNAAERNGRKAQEASLQIIALFTYGHGTWPAVALMAPYSRLAGT
jgi:hypothetical protein